MSARLAIFVGLLAVAVAVAVAVVPRAEAPADRVARLSSELRCPVCQGLSVEDSPSDTAREMRQLVAQRVDQGWSDDRIRAEFRAAYGDWIFLSPPLVDPRGAIWLVPLAVVALGTALVASRLRRAPPRAAPTDAQLALLRERAAEEARE
ncbi:MAG: cytochrome c-type biogenesis protein CcmH [Chloroflexota bacterium]|nr:cytochrome c-type biogenesis protein CcmH [Chloroflexota bacterium]MDE3194496.1 cytochrome c-type biogenesis protein CcmH [Chloroflexota bacterium]